MPKVKFYRGYEDSFGATPIPYGLLQLAGDLLTIDGMHVKVIDQEATLISNDDILDIAISFNPDIVGISLHASAGYGNAVRIAKMIKEHVPNSVIIAGGHHATFVPFQLLREGFDVVVRGEGDETIIELAKAIQDDLDFKRVKGIVFKDKDGKLVETEPRPLIQDLDKLPLPAFHLIDRDKYRIRIFDENGYFAAMETARGCPYACDFCSVTPTWGYRWRNKSNKRILEELRIIKKLGYNWVFFVDDIFIVWPNIRQRISLFKQMINEELKINFIAQMRVDVTANNPEVIKLAAEAGLRVAFLGVESGSEKVIKEMHKGIRPDQALEAVKILDNNGVVVFIGMILGAPYETLKDMIATIRYAYRLSDHGADGVQFSIYTPLPGTRIFDKLLREGKIYTLDWDYYDLLRPVMVTKVNPILIQILALIANHSFYIRKFIKSKLTRKKIPGKKKELIINGERFLIRSFPKFIWNTIKFPKSLFETYLLIRKWKKTGLPKDFVDELLYYLNKIVYLEINDKNPYFNIKND
jgi:anaerobic magnesium-protoporphyrin IX monomethyl ester cyclase